MAKTGVQAIGEEIKEEWPYKNRPIPACRKSKKSIGARDGGQTIHVADIPNAACYLKEARAMLAGKDTRFKNRCQKLPGDE